jgi:hypothetical protein
VGGALAAKLLIFCNQPVITDSSSRPTTVAFATQADAPESIDGSTLMTYLDEVSNSASKTRRQQEDQRRMAYRRAIEDFTEERRLQLELSDYPDLLAASHAAASQAPRQSEPPAR